MASKLYFLGNHSRYCALKIKLKKTPKSLFFCNHSSLFRNYIQKNCHFKLQFTIQFLLHLKLKPKSYIFVTIILYLWGLNTMMLFFLGALVLPRKLLNAAAGLRWSYMRINFWRFSDRYQGEFMFTFLGDIMWDFGSNFWESYMIDIIVCYWVNFWLFLPIYTFWSYIQLFSRYR